MYKVVLSYADTAELAFSGVEFGNGEKGQCPFEVDVNACLQIGEQTRHETFRANGMAIKTEDGWRFSAFESISAE